MRFLRALSAIVVSAVISTMTGFAVTAASVNAMPDLTTAAAQSTEKYTASGRSGDMVRDICADWKFGGKDLSETEATRISFDDSSWANITIPHTWNTKDAEDGGGNYLRTAYWYRKNLEWNNALTGKRAYIEFLGANQKTDLYVNEKHVPYNGTKEYTHKGGYTVFRYDITDYLTPGKNLLAVRVDNRRDDEIAPISADFNMYGGIYRRVFLIVTDDVHIDLNNNGSSGLFLTTPGTRSLNAPENLGALNIKADIVNDGNTERTVTVTTAVTGDNAPGPITETVTVPAHGRYSFNKDIKVENPHLWNGISYERGADNSDVGYRYTVSLEIKDGSDVLDKVSDKVGFRYFWVDKETGFYLNGKSHPLRGVNRHQFWEGKGSAISEAEHDTDMEIMKELGVNTIRLCHYPHTEYFYDLCDENGMIIWTEIPFVNELGRAESFTDVTKKQLVELIRQQYNRPSVCFWGLENEVGNGKSSNSYINMKQLINELDALAHKEDSSGRYTVQAINRDYAMDQKGAANFNDFTNNTGWKSDIVAWNIYPGWYNDNNFTGTFEEVMDRKASGDSRAMGLSEYGWGANANQHELFPALNKNGLTAGGRWHPEEYQSMMHEKAMSYINSHSSLWGTYVWAMFDFAVDSRNEGSQIALNDKGLVTGDRKIKKDSFYLYKANWNKNDIFTHITSARYTKRDSSQTYIKVYSNCDSVELFNNGISLGRMTSRGNGIFETESTALAVGENHIKAVGRISGETSEYTDECVWTREISKSTDLVSDTLLVDNTSKTVIISKEINLSQLRTELKAVNNGTYRVFGHEEITDGTASVTPGMEIHVTAEDGVTTAVYKLIAANICAGKTVEASSAEAGNIPQNAVDGDNGTRWTASDNKYPQSITVDLGEDYFMGNLAIDWFTKDNRCYKYNVEISSDGKNFTRVIDRSNNTAIGAVIDDMRLCRGRYLRINVIGCSRSEGYAALYEIKLNGWMLSSDKYTVDHENRLIIVPETGDNGGLTPEILDSNIKISGNCTYSIQAGTGYVNDGNTVEIADSDGRIVAYTVCTAETAPYKTANIALCRDVYFSSEEGQGTDGALTVAGNINDGIFTSRWASDTKGGKEAKYPEWVGIDLGREYELSSIDIYFETKADRVYSYQIYASSDVPLVNGGDIPAGYKLIADKTHNTISGHCTDLVSGKHARYIAVKITGCDKWSESAKYVAPSIFEIEVTGKTVSPKPLVSIAEVKAADNSAEYVLHSSDDFDSDIYDVYTAFYDADGGLAAVTKNMMSGMVQFDTGILSEVKVMVWERGTAIPAAEALTESVKVSDSL